MKRRPPRFTTSLVSPGAQGRLPRNHGEHILGGQAVEPSQACQAGLETRTHPGEAVPCQCCACEPSQPSEWPFFGNNGKYALTKATVSRSRQIMFFDNRLRWHSRELRLGNIRSAYAIVQVWVSLGLCLPLA